MRGKLQRRCGWVLLLIVVSGCASRAPSEPVVPDAASEVANQVLDRFMGSFNAQDPAAHVETLHFPHYRLARGGLSGWETRADGAAWMAETFPQLVASGWARSEWLERKIITHSASKIHVATRFRRLRADGSEIGSYASLYILTKVDGRWGVKLRSSYL